MLDPDLTLIIGLVLFLLSILSIVSAWADGRRPWVGGLTLIVALGLIALAFVATSKPYTLQGLPDVVFSVLGRYVL